MTLLFDPQTYAHLPARLWPVVFLRLCSLCWWSLFQDRAVFFSIDRNGAITLHYVEPDARDLSYWMGQQAMRPAAHLAYCDNDDGALAVNPIVVLVGRALERFGHLIRWAWVRIVLRAIPPYKDSS